MKSTEKHRIAQNSTVQHTVEYSCSTENNAIKTRKVSVLHEYGIYYYQTKNAAVLPALYSVVTSTKA